MSPPLRVVMQCYQVPVFVGFRPKLRNSVALGDSPYSPVFQAGLRHKVRHKMPRERPAVAQNRPLRPLARGLGWALVGLASPCARPGASVYAARKLMPRYAPDFPAVDNAQLPRPIAGSTATLGALGRTWHLEFISSPLAGRPGGTRWFFRCPSCGRRAHIVYLDAVQRALGCRTCLRLDYRPRNRQLRAALRASGHAPVIINAREDEGE